MLKLACPGFPTIGVPMQVSAAQQHRSQSLMSEKLQILGLAFASMAVLGGPCVMMRPAQAENPNELRQLLSSKTCAGCNLSQAGLVFANLEAAELNNADLSRANLSRATLSNADLRGANLAGAVLYGANLYNADLTGADLRGADLRGAYLGGAKLDGNQLQGAVLQGAIAIPPGLINAETYQTWAINEAQASRHEAAVTYYNQALEKDPRLATSYLGRSFSVSVLGQLEQATRDAEMAKQLFEVEQNPEGLATAEQVLLAIASAEAAAADWEALPSSEKASAGRANNGSRRNWGRAFSSLFRTVGTMVFRTVF